MSRILRWHESKSESLACGGGGSGSGAAERSIATHGNCYGGAGGGGAGIARVRAAAPDDSARLTLPSRPPAAAACLPASPPAAARPHPRAARRDFQLEDTILSIAHFIYSTLPATAQDGRVLKEISNRFRDTFKCGIHKKKSASNKRDNLGYRKP